MENAIAIHKRPCSICRRWFSPDTRLKQRQKTCGDEACKREWHRRKCAQWNRENSVMISRERLVRNLRAIAARSGQSKATGEPHPGRPPFNDGCKARLLTPFAQEVMA